MPFYATSAIGCAKASLGENPTASNYQNPLRGFGSLANHLYLCLSLAAGIIFLVAALSSG